VRFIRPFIPAAGLALAAAAMSAGPPQAPAPRLLEWPDLMGRPRPEPDATIAYGDDPLQIADLWLPKGKGPFAIVLMVHGGCWQSNVADRRIMNWAADDLRRRGIAVWNIEYRGVDRKGGGYPGTFLDVAAAADALRAQAKLRPLDLDRLVAIGHSAGGHLALWLAGRRRIARGSPLHANSPVPIRAAVSLGGLPDLELAARDPANGCGTQVVGRLTGGGPRGRDPFADTSVPRLAPLGVRQALINGTRDPIIPPGWAGDYAGKMRAAGDRVVVRMIDGAGHAELIAPETGAWAAAVAQIEADVRK
jgi:acetyl esterase/lipase